MAENKSLKGVFAAVSTPLTDDFWPDIPRLIAHCDWLLANGCDGLALLGTTGEANSIGLDERMILIDQIGTSDLPMERMIIGTGLTSVADTVQASLLATEIGVNGLLMLPPFYYKNPSEDGLFRYFSAVAELLADRAPRIFLYHFPQMSAVPITIALVRRLRAAFPGVFVGLKDSSGDFDNTAAFIREFPGFEIFAGSETLAVQTLAAGGQGCISATANVSAPIVARRISGAAGDAARLDHMIDAVRAEISAVGNVSGTKAALSIFRNDREWARVAPPNVALDAAAARRLAARLDEISDIRSYFG